ncbi:glycerophosphodiester phosphodiesterase [Cohnella faecalis]|nr:glycerophosphodiester phosphodiesterase family protein [Cohnella faecalis]
MKQKRQIRIIALVCCIFAVQSTLFEAVAHSPEYEAVAPPSESNKYVLSLAHRGASGFAPENTLSAFDLAVRLKADYLELDVQMSKDGHLVVIHDTMVNRTTDGEGKVKNLTFDQLRSLDAGMWFDPFFAGERIPAFGEILDRYRGRIGMVIEIKQPELYPGIEEKIAGELAARGMHAPDGDSVIVQSFDLRALRHFHTLLPFVPLGLLISRASDSTDRRLDEFAKLVRFVNPVRNLVNESLIDRIHARGMSAFVWPIRKRKYVNGLIADGVDGLITDYPDVVTSARNGWR